VAQSISSLPLSALRFVLDEGSRRAHWSVDPDGVSGRCLVCDAGARVSFPLTLEHPTRLHTQALLLPHDWRDGHGQITAQITITDTTGHHRQLWTGQLATARELGHPDGHPIALELPAGTHTLHLHAHPPTRTHTGEPVARLLFRTPELIDPTAPPAPTPPHPEPHTPPEHGPTISILTPVHDPAPHMLAEAIESVLHQSYPHWQLCLVDDGSQNPEITTALQHHADSDPRITLTRHPTAQGISAATNTALQHATGDYIALLDHDDTLHPHALAHIATTINHDPTLDMIYTDEAIIDDEGVIGRHHKPGWSPENLSTVMYTCHLGVYRRALVDDLGGFRSEYDGCQDHDLALRVIESSERVAHVPELLYHWRSHAGSAASGADAKPYAYVKAQRVISAHLERSGVPARVDFGAFPGLYRITQAPPSATDVVLALTETAGLAEAARGWQQSEGLSRVVVSCPESIREACSGALRDAGLEAERTVLVDAGPGESAASGIAAAAQRAMALGAERLLLLESPATGITHDWLRRLSSYAAQPGVGIAGPLVASSDGRILHAGVAFPCGFPLPLQHGLPVAAGGHQAINVSAVSGALAIAASRLRELDGLDSSWEELMLVELCLRAGGDSRRVVLVSDARLRATTASTPPTDLGRMRRLATSRGVASAGDRFYNPHLRADRGDFALLPV
jgi:hypothetical protein